MTSTSDASREGVLHAYFCRESGLGDHRSALRALFEPFGTVERARIVTDRETGRSRGFGFVEMPNAREAQAAIEELHGMTVKGRPLTVNEARQREDGDGRRRPRG
jgi:RNA recognition motif-containing protein